MPTPHRIISAAQIEAAVRDLFIEANYKLPACAEACLRAAAARESNALAKSVLGVLEENIAAASELNIPLCQDTGMAVLFADIGCETAIDGDFEAAVNRGVARAYGEGYLRASVAGDLFDHLPETQPKILSHIDNHLRGVQ